MAMQGQAETVLLSSTEISAASLQGLVKN